MRALIQRVSRAHLTDKSSREAGTLLTGSAPVIASIRRGLILFLGFEEEDSFVVLDQMAHKIKNLRIFSDPNGKMNLAGSEIGAQYLLVSQFTLYADCKHGNRPSFTKAAPKERAKALYLYFVDALSRQLGEGKVQASAFGSDLLVELVNDGPVTLWLDSKEVI